MGSKEQHQPLINTGNMKIEQIGIVVRDAHKTAKKYAEILGLGPWVFMDFAPRELVFRNQPLEEGSCLVRAALAQLGRIQIELLQPMYGPSTYASFLKDRGEGIHHLSFGIVADHDSVVSALKEQGTQIEMEGVLSGFKFTYTESTKDLGTIFEFSKPLGENADAPKPWGSYQAKGPGLIQMEGSEIAQVGIVVEDAEKTARNYWEILGIGPWMFFDLKPPHVSNCTLHEIDMINLEDVHVKFAVADFGQMQIELLEPIAGPSTYMEFLKTCGPGVHHVSFGDTKDHNEVVSTLKNNGIGIEMDGVLGGDGVRFTYMATQKDLGTIIEWIELDPEAQITLVPYGGYPLSEG